MAKHVIDGQMKWPFENVNILISIPANISKNLQKTLVDIFEPTRSNEHSEHYMMVSNTQHAKLAEPNELLPSNNISKCEYCPAWCFSSKTEKCRHMSLLHSRKWRAQDDAGPVKEFKCTFEGCQLEFHTYHQLRIHKIDLSHHFRKRKCASGESEEVRTKIKKTLNGYLNSSIDDSPVDDD